mgnify:CR=1 FL=1
MHFSQHLDPAFSKVKFSRLILIRISIEGQLTDCYLRVVFLGIPEFHEHDDYFKMI